MNINGLTDLLVEFPGLSISPASQIKGLVIEGEVDINHSYEDLETIVDSYLIQIHIPEGFPDKVPTVFELGNKIERSLDYHMFKLDDGSYQLCLGTQTRLLSYLKLKPNICEFVQDILIPWLYSASYKRKTGKNFPVGELRHGFKGVMDDYANIFNVDTKAEVVRILEILSIKKRSAANKQRCPYGCKLRLGLCKHRYEINRYRELRDSSYYKNDLEIIRGLSEEVEGIL